MIVLYQVHLTEELEAPRPVGVSYAERDKAIAFAKAQFPYIRGSSSFEFKAIEMAVVEYRAGMSPVVTWKEEV